MTSALIEHLPVYATLAIGATILVAYIAILIMVLNEAGRRMGRDLGVLEAVLLAVTMPYSGAYVFFIMDERKLKDTPHE